MADRVYPPVIAVARTVFVGLGLTFDITGEEHVPRHGGAIMAINHVGLLDFTFAGLAAHPSKRFVRFMAKEAIFEHWAAGPLMRGMHHISVDRSAGASSYAAALRALKDGEVIGVFPEATVSPSWELLPFKNGVVRMAAATGVPILPTVLWGSQRVLTHGHRRKANLERIPISIDVGTPLEVGRRDDPAVALAQLRDQMEQMLHAAQERYPVKPKPGEHPWWLPARLGGSAPTPAEGEAMVAHRREGRPSAS